jgi:NAD(P)H-hydrate epimerase
MINGYTSDQVRAAEAPSLAKGVPLMKRAAAGLAEAVRSLLPATGGTVLVLAGSGNNGADALYAAAELAEAGTSVSVVLASDHAVAEALSAATAAGVVTIENRDAAALASSADIVVDGILGTGTSSSPALRGSARDLVAALLPALMQNPDAYVVAVDIPSGISPDDGTVPDPLVIPADVTVTFGARKAGLLIAPGSDFAGEVRLIDIGLDAEFAAMEPAVSLEDPEISSL